MHKHFRRRWLVAGLLLAASCRSERAAFSFRPATSAATLAAPVAPTPQAIPTPLAASRTAAPPVSRQPIPAAPSATVYSVATKVSIQSSSGRIERAVTRFRQPVYRRASRAEVAGRTARIDTLHWVLGGALVVVGVVAGILLGGWLGIGVGAALVLLGYYFVVMGIGGRQAWLEVFQEFFNM